MKVIRNDIKACCGKTSVIFKTDQPLTKEIIKSLVALGFNEASHFTQAGILYVDNKYIILTGPLGSDKLQVKCKSKQCEDKINELEELLKTI